ncbi:MerR family transcriptional regulator [Antrihabitans sp. YC3-6]|uniref:MerR family transcriptional regulator n=1 Tax=Antrihabitans stalagmiti TaxID=2799499 RepID=A0A934U6M0_9NOCA|nr:MerR family transcriptional regulator [Antrihabitans stalagmiti]MBJ8342063.1 MerR family transcriptional regulator [Antrihabitans stalagmiti]
MTTIPAMKIGDAAAALGIEAHVLRHWESVGLLAPKRSQSGHRSYDEHILDYARLIHTLQRAGLSLDQIRRLGYSAREQRLSLIDARRAEVRKRIALLHATDRFLEHLAACSHPIIAECPECSDFAKRGHLRSSGKFPKRP